MNKNLNFLFSRGLNLKKHVLGSTLIMQDLMMDCIGLYLSYGF